MIKGTLWSLPLYLLSIPFNPRMSETMELQPWRVSLAIKLFSVWHNIVLWCWSCHTISWNMKLLRKKTIKSSSYPPIQLFSCIDSDIFESNLNNWEGRQVVLSRKQLLTRGWSKKKKKHLCGEFAKKTLWVADLFQSHCSDTSIRSDEYFLVALSGGKIFFFIDRWAINRWEQIRRENNRFSTCVLKKHMKC